MTTKRVFSELSLALHARANCEKSGNAEWHKKHTERIIQIVIDFMPSGSGVDNGTSIDIDASNPNRLVFYFGFHHMNENGYYDGWTDHSAIVTPSLAFEFDIIITGRNRNDIKSYLYDIFRNALESETEPASSKTKEG